MALNNNNNSNATTIDDNITSDTNDPSKRSESMDLVVRVEDNPADNLQALFDSVLKPGNSQSPLIVPLRMRKLPDSFFNPPSIGSRSPLVSHSRDDSGDSAIFGSGTTTICSPNSTNGIDGTNAVAGGSGATGGGTTPNGVVNPITSRLQAIHSRGHSCPASLQETYAGLNTHNAAAVVAAANNSAATNRTNQQQQVMTILPEILKRLASCYEIAVRFNNEIDYHLFDRIKHKLNRWQQQQWPVQYSQFIEHNGHSTWSVRFNYLKNWANCHPDGNKHAHQTVQSITLSEYTQFNFLQQIRGLDGKSAYGMCHKLPRSIHNVTYENELYIVRVSTS